MVLTIRPCDVVVKWVKRRLRRLERRKMGGRQKPTTTTTQRTTTTTSFPPPPRAQAHRACRQCPPPPAPITCPTNTTPLIPTCPTCPAEKICLDSVCPVVECPAVECPAVHCQTCKRCPKKAKPYFPDPYRHHRIPICESLRGHLMNQDLEQVIFAALQNSGTFNAFCHELSKQRRLIRNVDEVVQGKKMNFDRELRKERDALSACRKSRVCDIHACGPICLNGKYWWKK